MTTINGTEWDETEIARLCALEVDSSKCTPGTDDLFNVIRLARDFSCEGLANPTSGAATGYRNQAIKIFSENVIANAAVDGEVDILNNHQFDIVNLVGLPASAVVTAVSFRAIATAATRSESTHDVYAIVNCASTGTIASAKQASAANGVRANDRNWNSVYNDRLVAVPDNGIFDFSSHHLYREFNGYNGASGSTWCQLHVRGVLYEYR